MSPYIYIQYMRERYAPAKGDPKRTEMGNPFAGQKSIYGEQQPMWMQRQKGSESVAFGISREYGPQHRCKWEAR